MGRWKGDWRPYLGIFAGSVTSADFLVEFRGDRTAETTLTVVVMPGALTYQNCLIVYRETGMTWTTSTTNGVSTLSASAPTASTQTRTNCSNPMQNQATSANTDASRARSWTYTITGTQLILSNSDGNATLTRQ